MRAWRYEAHHKSPGCLTRAGELEMRADGWERAGIFVALFRGAGIELRRARVWDRGDDDLTECRLGWWAPQWALRIAFLRTALLGRRESNVLTAPVLVHGIDKRTTARLLREAEANGGLTPEAQALIAERLLLNPKLNHEQEP